MLKKPRIKKKNSQKSCPIRSRKEKKTELKKKKAKQENCTRDKMLLKAL